PPGPRPQDGQAPRRPRQALPLLREHRRRALCGGQPARGSAPGGAGVYVSREEADRGEIGVAATDGFREVAGFGSGHDRPRVGTAAADAPSLSSTPRVLWLTRG